MPARTKTSPASEGWDSDLSLLAWLATCVAVFAFLFLYQRGEILLYGDAVAHINIARRVFDSKTPGLLQLGTVWLPLPHLLMIPFLISGEMWRRGAGGSIPSMAAYVFGVVGMFRLVRGSLSRDAQPDRSARFAAWISAIVFAANPNLIYLQATAMGEAIYLAFFIWTVVYFEDFIRGTPRALTKCGLCLAAACLTRYDGWFLSLVIIVAVAVPAWTNRADDPLAASARTLRLAAMKFTLLALSAPALWLAYNAVIYRNPLEFENGPYSARAIERHTEAAGAPGHPGEKNPLLAGWYFLKAAEMNLAGPTWLQRLWVLLGFAAIIGGKFLQPSKVEATAPETRYGVGLASLLLLMVPWPFYALSIADGGVPLFVPTWWPFSYYNVRYGLELLPAFSVASGIVAFLAVRFLAADNRLRLVAVFGICAFIIASYASVWQSGPVSLHEAQINMRAKNHLEQSLADWLKHLPPDSTLLMYLGDHVGALEQAGVPLRHVINEGNHRVWKQPVDPEGLWERALNDPSSYADYAVAFEGDPVWRAVEGRHLREMIEIHVTGQARAVVYRAR